MAQNDIALMGAVYPDVPAVTLPIDGGGTAKFTDVSDTTASASDVAQGKYFYTSSGVYTQGTASGGGAGASNYVTGTFKGTTTGAAMDVNLPYTGNGYPVALLISVTGGSYASSSATQNAQAWYNLVQRYAVAQFAMTKSNEELAPSYTSTGDENQGFVTIRCKSTTSSSTTYTNGGGNSANSYYTDGAKSTNTAVARFKSKNVLSVYIASSNNYGFAANIEYTYHIIYSS